MARRDTGWVGWIYFGSFLMMLEGMFQVIFGLVALFNDQLIVTANQSTWLVDITTWGWAHLLLGLVLFLAGLSLLSGKMWARITAVIVVTISALVNFTFIPVYPIWSIVLLTIDSLIIYAVIAHGEELED